ncbi:FtsB family cell division protein [Prauserella muralis]|uniref:Uncharacterized protein n=1 Tax=Prauserella muralis TaxID=588067 RepID=A0A2V4B1V4_9PSEU|nr:septum formation initiator [Prauserella muralis]PXY28033.1 hypothetical protein BAY60_16970 [Prauserella muralis]TWE22172.1 hypothetical protein FHX69_3406 [Prauserella muralis]
MTAPARSRTRTRTRTPPVRTRRQAMASAPAVTPELPDVGAPRRRSSAAERAYARRAQRADELRRADGPDLRQGPPRLRLRWPRSRASFVLLLMALLVSGVAATLWLSTQAITDSYRLEELREQNARLAERAEQLQRDVATAESPSSLAERARALGMVPGGNPARLVVGEDGTVRVVGEPSEATAPAPPPEPDPDPEPQQPEQNQHAQDPQAQDPQAQGGDRQAQDHAENQAQDQQAQGRQGGDQQGRQEEQGTTGGD